jgi:hypothetical protein
MAPRKEKAEKPAKAGAAAAEDGRHFLPIPLDATLRPWLLTCPRFGGSGSALILDYLRKSPPDLLSSDSVFHIQRSGWAI